MCGECFALQTPLRLLLVELDDALAAMAAEKRWVSLVPRRSSPGWSAAEEVVNRTDQWHKKCFQLQKWEGCMSFRRKRALRAHVLYW